MKITARGNFHGEWLAVSCYTRENRIELGVGYKVRATCKKTKTLRMKRFLFSIKFKLF